MEDHMSEVGIGLSQNADPVQAGEEAARVALEGLGPNEATAWALAFCGGRHSQEDVLGGMRSQLGEVGIIGGSAVGVITNTSLGYTGYECALVAFPASIPEPTIVVANGMDAGEVETGRRLGEELGDVAHDGDTVLLFYDSIRGGPPPVLYIGSRLVDGIYQGLAGKHVKLIGAGTVGDFSLSESYIFDGRGAAKHGAVAVVMPSALDSHTSIMHGCIPVSSFLEVTKIEGAVVYELDGRPALEVLGAMLGSAASNLSLVVTLGQKQGDPYAPYDESAYVNRLIISANPQDGSVTLFEADFQEGSQVQVMSRSNQVMIESVQARTRALLASLGQQKPIFALYIDCAGRASSFSGSDVEEGSILQAELGEEIPLLGFYSGVEIAPLVGRSHPLDWTGVLTLFTPGSVQG
jgi:hypothetical protein